MVPRLFRRRDDRPSRRLRVHRRPLIEALEGRQLLSSFTVSNDNDSGAGSLRQAILSSNATTGSTVNTISFKIGTGGTQTVALKSALPAITHPVVIDGTTQPNASSFVYLVSALRATMPNKIISLYNIGPAASRLDSTW